MSFKFSARSRKALVGVHPDLVRLTERALSLSAIDFVITEGLRTVERQRELVAAGASRTLDSRHITGHAIDVAAWLGEVRWDFGLYIRIAIAFRDAAKIERVPVRWGGCWQELTPGADPGRLYQEYAARKRAANQRPLIDGPHYELPRARYPA